LYNTRILLYIFDVAHGRTLQESITYFLPI